MKLLFSFFSIASILWIVLVSPVGAEEQGSRRAEEIGAEVALPLVGTAADLLAQGVTRVTGVEVIQTESGLELILETVAGSARLVPLVVPEGNDLVIDILDATLAFSIRNGVSELNPAPGIRRITVNKAEENSIQVRITGENQAPSAEVVTGREDLVLSVTPDGTTAETEPDEEIEVIATGQAENDDYNVDNASTATRTNTPLRDIPQSIQVVPEQVIEDRKPKNLTEAVETVSGVVDGGDYFGGGTGKRIIRGFDQGTGNGNFRNGFRDANFYTLTGVGTIDRLEVLKGPASVLFGAVEPGGIVNVITKQPLSDPFYQIAFEAGNLGFYQPSVDLSGPLNTDATILYRFIASYQGTDSFQDFVTTNLATIAPTITWKLGERTNLNLYYEYLDYLGNPSESYTGIFSDGSLFPQSFYAGYPDFTFNNIKTQKIGYILEHEFNDNWQLRNNFAVVANKAYEEYAFAFTLIDDRELELGAFDREFAQDNYFAQIDLLGKFNTGAIAHQLLIGFDFNRYVEIFESEVGSVPNLNIFDPDYDIADPEYFPSFITDEATETYGIYLQDQINLLSNFKLLVGGRFDWVSRNETTDEIDSPEQNDSAFSPRIGLVYQPSDVVSLYASYSRSFIPEFGFNPDDVAFEPTKGTQYEVGVKTDFLEGKLSTTLAAYHITKTNVTTPDPNDPSFSIQTGEQRSQGIELDVTGEIVPGWNVTAAYAYTDAEITEDNSFTVGNGLTNVPENQASLWTTYEIQKGTLEGLGFGLGLFYIGERQGDLDNSFELEDYLRTDAALYYRQGRLNTAINIRNLFDTDYIRSSEGGSLFLQRGKPFTITGSVSWEF